MARLGELVEIKGGGTPSKAVPEYWGGEIPWASVKDFKSSILEFTADSITELGVKNSATSVIPAGTIVVPTRMALGKVAITAVDMAINQDLKALSIINEQELNKGYLLRFLESQASEIEKQGKGATVKGITLDVLRCLEIPLPPLAEQKRIAAILDKADALRRKRQQAIELADQFLRSVFLDMFGDPITNPKGWEVRKLIALCKKITDGTHHSPPIVEEGVPYITAKHLKKTGLEFFANPWFVSEQSHKEIFARCAPNKNDVLYIKDGATTGLAAINEYDFPFSMLSSLALLKPDYSEITSEFLCMFLNHPRTKQVLTANMAGAAITRLTLAKIKDVDVPTPSLNKQQEFSMIYRKVRETLVRINTSAESLDLQFKSLSQQAFSGKL